MPKLISVTELAKSLKVNVATVYRWILYGVRGRKLPSLLIGGRRFVDEDDFEQFIGAKQDIKDPSVQSRWESAKRELSQLGVRNTEEKPKEK